jgi:hypothetical protein
MWRLSAASSFETRASPAPQDEAEQAASQVAMTIRIDDNPA